MEIIKLAIMQIVKLEKKVTESDRSLLKRTRTVAYEKRKAQNLSGKVKNERSFFSD